MAGETVITVVGNLVDDPELRFTPSGAAVANFRVASTPRTFDRQSREWKDGEALFLSCSVWRQAAENVAESLQKGMRVVVQGRLKQRSYEDREGQRRTVVELDVDEVGPSLKYATAKVARVSRGSGGVAPAATTRGPVRAAASPPRVRPGWPVRSGRLERPAGRRTGRRPGGALRRAGPVGRPRRLGGAAVLSPRRRPGTRPVRTTARTRAGNPSTHQAHHSGDLRRAHHEGAPQWPRQ